MKTVFESHQLLVRVDELTDKVCILNKGPGGTGKVEAHIIPFGHTGLRITTPDCDLSPFDYGNEAGVNVSRKIEYQPA